jgi:alpha-tubulin suppressor-like RCC1 family protein
VTASFAINTYTINYSAETGGSVSSTLSQTVDYNSSTTQVEAIPDSGYTFISWSDGLTTTSRVDNGITSNATYTASFGIINISSPLENAELNLDTDFTISGTSSLNISSVTIEASNNTGTSWIQIATTTSNGAWSTTAQLSSSDFSIGDNIIIRVSSGVVEKEVNVLIENNISVSFFEKANIGGTTLAAIFDGRVYSWGGNPTIMGNSRVRTNSPVPFNVDTSGVLNNKNIVQLSGKNSHSLALDEDGNVYAWGFNTSGQLGNGNTTNSAIPILVNIPNSGKKIVQVSAGNQHSLALDEDGNLYSWGANSFGQLGDGSTSQKTTPVLVNTSTLNSKKIVQISAGAFYNLLITEDNEVYAWGVNSDGRLGDGSTSQRTTPVLVNTSTFAGNKIIQVSAGGYSLALDENGNVYAWGPNSYGQLGDGSTIQKTTPVLVNTSTFAGNKIIQVSAGSGHSLALDENGNVYAWGENLNGKLGDGSTDQRTIPVLVNTSTFAGNKIIYVGAGVGNSLVIDEFDHVYTWGRNTFGEVGIGSYESMFTTPKKVYNYGVLYPKSIFKISGSYDYSLALDTNGQIYSWGYYEFLGIDVHNNQNRHFPVEVNTSTFINNIVDIDVGLAHSLALDENGNVYSWGYNSSGQLGDGSTSQKTTPVLVNTSTFAGNKIIQISASSFHSLALDENGNVYAWGENLNGQLGDGSTSQKTTPVLVNTSTFAGNKIIQVSAGGNDENSFSLALDENGNVYSWGYNSSGQLGDGSTSQKTTPVLVNTSTFAGNKIIQISAGGSHSLALDEYENTYAWGANSYGQLGDGSTIQKTIPVLVNTSTFAGNKIIQVSAGGSHSLLLDQEGSVFACGGGYINYGQLGDGLGDVWTTRKQSIAVKVDTSGVLADKQIINISAGYYHSLVFDENNDVYAWGYNSSGQLGTNISEEYLYSPALVYRKP